MEKKKNIIVLSGKDTHRIEKELERFLGAFRDRQDPESIDMFRIEEISDWRSIHGKTQTIGLFAEKRLFVFRGSTEKSGKKGKKGEGENETEKEFLSLLKNISEDTFVIFASVKFEEGGDLIGFLRRECDIREYSDLWDTSSWGSRFPTLEKTSIEAMICEVRKTPSEESEELDISLTLASALEKLSLIRESRPLKETDYETTLAIEQGAKIFDLSDSIMRGDSIRSITHFRNLLKVMDAGRIMGTLISLLRTGAYVKYMKSLGLSQQKITATLSAHPYTVQKSYESNLSHESFVEVYTKFISINTAYKSGKGKKDTELGYIFDIELGIMGLKK